MGNFTASGNPGRPTHSQEASSYRSSNRLSVSYFDVIPSWYKTWQHSCNNQVFRVGRHIALWSSRSTMHATTDFAHLWLPSSHSCVEAFNNSRLLQTIWAIGIWPCSLINSSPQCSVKLWWAEMLLVATKHTRSRWESSWDEYKKTKDLRYILYHVALLVTPSWHCLGQVCVHHPLISTSFLFTTPSSSKRSFSSASTATWKAGRGARLRVTPLHRSSSKWSWALTTLALGYLHRGLKSENSLVTTITSSSNTHPYHLVLHRAYPSSRMLSTSSKSRILSKHATYVSIWCGAGSLTLDSCILYIY